MGTAFGDDLVEQIREVIASWATEKDFSRCRARERPVRLDRNHDDHLFAVARHDLWAHLASLLNQLAESLLCIVELPVHNASLSILSR